jgi:membrane protease YdiL (CAAX protease family)
LLFGLIHPGFVLAFLMGLALAYIYLQVGLLPAMIVHFLGDLVPLSLWALSWQ